MSNLYYFNQLNYRNAPYNKPNGTKTTIAKGGCGPTSATIVFDTLSQKQMYTPITMAKFAQKCGARTNNGTNEATLLNALCEKHKDFSWKGSNDINALVKHLKNGGMAVCNQGDDYNVFSTQGHFVVAWRMVGDNIEVADPSNTSNKYNLYNRPQRIVKKTQYGCIVKPEQMRKATSDRNPSFYLVTYKGKTPSKDIKAGDKVILKTNNICYKSTAKDAYTFSEITKYFYGEDKARLRKEDKYTVKSVEKVDGNVWITVNINKKVVYILAYKKSTNKWYVKKV